MMSGRVIGIVVVAGLSLSAPATLQAQGSQPDLTTLMRNQMLDVWLAKTADGTPVLVNPPNATDLTTTNPFTLVTQIEQQIGTQLSSLPLGSSSGGFTYGYEPSLGTFTRTTETFGPAFAERAQTLGRGRINFGVSYQRSRYSDLDGRSLEGGALTFILPPGTLTDPAVGNVIEAEMHLRLASQTTVTFLTAGVTNRLDVGVAVPYQQVDMDLTSRATIHDFSSSTVSPASRVFRNGTRTQDFVTSGSARGVGDVVLRGKYKLSRAALREFALCVDLRLPTGDAANMLGTGGKQTQVLLVSSYSASKVDPHFNVGYTFSDQHAADQINYVAGIEVAASQRLTIIGDLIGRMFRDTLRLSDTTVSILQPADGGAGAPALTSASFATVEPQTGSLTSVLGSVGVKYNPVGNVLISAHVLATVSDGGLRRRLTPVIGLDYSF
jgi:hypothetical protein